MLKHLKNKIKSTSEEVKKRELQERLKGFGEKKKETFCFHPHGEA